MGGRLVMPPAPTTEGAGSWYALAAAVDDGGAHTSAARLLSRSAAAALACSRIRAAVRRVASREKVTRALAPDATSTTRDGPRCPRRSTCSSITDSSSDACEVPELLAPGPVMQGTRRLLPGSPSRRSRKMAVSAFTAKVARMPSSTTASDAGAERKEAVDQPTSRAQYMTRSAAIAKDAASEPVRDR